MNEKARQMYTPKPASDFQREKNYVPTELLTCTLVCLLLYIYKILNVRLLHMYIHVLLYMYDTNVCLLSLESGIYIILAYRRGMQLVFFHNP